MRRKLSRFLALGLVGLLVQLGSASAFRRPATPIKHVVVIFQENVSFDHYFATYPNAKNPKGEPQFIASGRTPNVNGLSGPLLKANPNFFNVLNESGAVNPFRLDRSQAATADQDHDYTPEQMAYDHGLMDLFPMSVGTAGPPPGSGPGTTTGLTMGYYDGNTVTAFWNYAQHFAMSDNSYDTDFGPSTPGAINLISGQTNGVIATLNGTGDEVGDGGNSLTLISDADPIGDVCSSPTGGQAQMGGKSIGDLLSAAGVTWGFFEGGFNLSLENANGTTACKRSTLSAITNATKLDYIPHHQPFQYYASTANPTHARPGSVSAIGHDGDPANHQYDIEDFFAAVLAGNFPAVSFMKAPGFQDGHAGYSDPLDEQTFVVDTINFLEQQREWSDTAVIIAYDDSDGWYDHQVSPIVNQSATDADALSGTGMCGSGTGALPGIVINGGQNPHAQGRCGYGPRLPLMVISAWAKTNFVDHTVTDQTSIARFIEDNWLGGKRIGQGSFDTIAGPLDNMFDFRQDPNGHSIILDPDTGEPHS